MKRILLPIYLLSFSVLFAQQKQVNDTKHISTYFDEVKKATKKNIQIWNKDLYAGILLVDPKTRTVYSNVADAKNSLTKQNDIFIGRLPDSVNIANTALQWNGKPYAMIMLPLSNDKEERINLLAHELFHTTQSALGFSQNNKESNHLDQREGRIYLRLELEALSKAILADTRKEQTEHLTHAFIFRKYRNTLFPTSATIENQLELNEGIAEYTGFMMSGRNKAQIKQHFVNSNNAFFKNPTYVRSFAYYTTPIYGYLLSQKDKYWNQKIKPDSDLTGFFLQSFDLKLPMDLQQAATMLSDNYNGAIIFGEEKEREDRILKEITDYKIKFIEQPHFVLKFEKMNVSFDPRNIVPIDDIGTVYPTIRVTDNWGILEVSNGALMSANWDKITVSFPQAIDNQTIQGDGWVLHLNEKYSLQKDEKNNNYTLTKKVIPTS